MLDQASESTTNDEGVDSQAPAIFLDADACPVKEIVYRVAARYGIRLLVVSNSTLRIPDLAGLHAASIVVPGSMDAADDWIVERATPRDLVLTADIPLAARLVPEGIRCLDFRGGEFSPDRIGDALASRELSAHLRAMGVTTGGPSPFTDKDRGRFASLLDNAVSKLARDKANG